ncbi:hypothetical protein BKA62DRAFT_690597 [Auriculariales sp. MPI-PUGE-AT-0066]|nr:hypothetical protein BKA62DRAFT_690597 [Auriculariales sp. MPI-PUGE-AT-0066]
MAKSIRSKAKRTARRSKRESDNSAFAAQEAARLLRLNAKLHARTLLDPVPVHNANEDDEDDEDASNEAMIIEDGEKTTASTVDGMAVDSTAEKRISTHGPRNSGREQWRKSKGLAPRKKKNLTAPVNRQGIVPSTKRAGRSKRRR